jgi:hypothetical protein
LTVALIFPWAILGRTLQGFLTLLIAAIAVGIAYQQWVVNRRQYRLALFEKRMAIYNRTKEFIAEVMQRLNPQIPECITFMRDTRDHDFLFGPEIDVFINALYKNAVDLNTCNTVNAAQQRAEIVKWFSTQMGEATKLFQRYLDFREA